MYTGSPQPKDTGPPGSPPLVGRELAEILTVRLPRAETRSQWADRQAALAPLCRCGCGGRIQIRAQHRCPSRGLPVYLQGHHPNPLRRKYAEVRAAGLLLLAEACRELGIAPRVFRLREAQGLFPPVGRWTGIGGRAIRVLTRADLQRLRRFFRTR